MKLKLVVLICFFMNVLLFANNNEVMIYTATKYHMDFNKLKKEEQDKLTKEYENVKVLSAKVKDKIEKQNTYKVLNNITLVDVWEKEFVHNYTPSDKELKELFEKTKPKINEQYKLRTILVKYEKSAKRIMDSLAKIKDSKEKLSTFEKYVESYSTDLGTVNKEGKLDWLIAKKLKPSVQDLLKNKKVGDVVRVNLNNKAWQVLYIEDYIPNKVATFDEAKNMLINLAKKRALEEEIKKAFKKN